MISSWTEILYLSKKKNPMYQLSFWTYDSYLCVHSAHTCGCHSSLNLYGPWTHCMPSDWNHRASQNHASMDSTAQPELQTSCESQLSSSKGSDRPARKPLSLTALRLRPKLFALGFYLWNFRKTKQKQARFCGISLDFHSTHYLG